VNNINLDSFFYGTLLGDSYFHNGVFYCKQISKDLIEFKYKVIKDNLPNVKIKIDEYKEYIDKNNIKHQDYYVISASGNDYLKSLNNLFYNDNKKICPINIINKLDYLGMAMWFADDGATILVQRNESTGSAKCHRTQLCTDSFTKEEHDNIIIPELKQLGYESNYKKRGEHYRIEFLKPKNIQNLYIEMGKYFYNYFPSLLYKLDMGYRNSSLLNRTYVIQEYYEFYNKISTHPLFIDRMKIKEDIVRTTTTNIGS